MQIQPHPFALPLRGSQVLFLSPCVIILQRKIIVHFRWDSVNFKVLIRRQEGYVTAYIGKINVVRRKQSRDRKCSRRKEC